MQKEIIKAIRDSAFYIEPKDENIIYVNTGADGILDKKLKAVTEIAVDKAFELNKKLQDGRDYLMQVQSDEITVGDALEAFGFGRNGLG